MVSPRSEFQPQCFSVDDYATYYLLVKASLADAITDGREVTTYPDPKEHCDICRWRASSRSPKCVPGSTRTSTERALNAFPLPLGYRHVEDQAGFEPALGLSQRIKSPPRSAATVTGPWRTRVVTIHMPTG